MSQLGWCVTEYGDFCFLSGVSGYLQCEDRMRVRGIGIEDRKGKLHSLCVDESEQS